MRHLSVVFTCYGNKGMFSCLTIWLVFINFKLNHGLIINSVLDSNTLFMCTLKPNKWSKIFDERPHRMGGFFSVGQLMLHWPVGSIAVGCSSRAVMPLLRIEWSLSFAANTAAETSNAFNGPDNSPKLPLSVRGSRPPSNTWFLGLTRVTASQKTHLDRFSRFGMAHPVWPTDKQTDHTTCDICSNRPYLCNACDVA